MLVLNKAFAMLLLAAMVLMVPMLLLAGCSAKADTIRAIADQVAGYTLPEGYSESFVADLLGYQMVYLAGPSASSHIYLIQAPKGSRVDLTQLQQQARFMQGPRETPTLRDLHIVETRATQVRGEAAQVQVSEGVNADDLPCRVADVLFTGRGGPALASLYAPASDWDWELVNSFLASLQ